MKTFSLLLCSLAFGHLTLAAGVTDVTDADTFLIGQINKADSDINKLTVANAPVNGPGILQAISDDFDIATDSIEIILTLEIAPDEDLVLSSFSAVSKDLVKLADDLAGKKQNLKLMKRDNTMSNELDGLLSSFMSYSGQISRIVGSKAAKDSVSESSAKAYSAISNARNKYDN